MRIENEEKFLRELHVALQATSSVVRMKILRLVSKEAKSVSAIAEEMGLSPASVSAHVNILWKAGFLHRQKKGNQVFYQLNKDFVLEMQAMVRKFLGIE